MTAADYRQGVADGVRFAIERLGRDADAWAAAALAELAPTALPLPANAMLGDSPPLALGTSLGSGPGQPPTANRSGARDDPSSGAARHLLPQGEKGRLVSAARAPGAEIVFVCWKWASKYRHQYKAVHVNVLRNMVARHYAGAHRFICITDDAGGVAGETFPLWHDCANLINSSGAHMPSCYRRLKLFDPATQVAMGIKPGSRVISLDLDTIVCGDLAPLVEREEEFVGWALKGSYHPRVFNGSMFLFQAGALAQVWGDFDPDNSPRIAAEARFKGSDQSWLTYRVGVDRPGWTKVDGIYSYALDLRRDGAKLPHDARVVMFHGHIKPWHLAHVGRPGWVKEHWN